MRLDGVLPQRLHGITRELAKFGTIGVINLVINFAVSNALLLTLMHGSEVKAKAVATVVATTCAYFMNRHWTYRDRPKSTLRREYSLFFFFNLIGLVIETGTVAFTKYGLHETHILAFNISTGIGIGLGTLFRFWAYRTHVFKVDASPATAFAVALADSPELPEDAATEQAAADEQERATTAVAPPRLIVTSTEQGSVVIKVVDAGTQALDEINLDSPART